MLDDRACSLNSSKSACSHSNIDQDRQLRRELNREQVNLETHQLVWLDPDFVNNDVTLERLRQIIDYTKIFHSIDDCLQYINETKNSSKIFLVCTKELGQELLSHLHSNDRHIHKTYMYTKDEKHEKVPSNSQTDEVYQDIIPLLGDLEQDVQQYSQNEKHFDFSDLKKTEKSTDNFGGAWWEVFIKLLAILPYPTDHRGIFIQTLKDYYKGNESQIRKLQQFESEYKPEDAILWFTRDTFLFRLLNQALRQHNIEVMFLFGFYLQDLYRQMQIESERFKQAHIENPVIKLYRGQMMRLRELNELNVGDYIINNSFLSTTFDRTVASYFLTGTTSPTTDELQGVLFQFQIDVRQQQGVNPYADISHLSHFSQEREVLFMAGSPFKLCENRFDDVLKVWIVELELYLNIHLRNVQDFEKCNYTERRLLKNYINILPNGIYRASTDEINLIFDEIINIFPSAERWIAAERLHCLAIHEQGKELNADKALLLHDQAIEKWEEFLDDDDEEFNCSFNLAEIHTTKAVGYTEGIKYPKMELAEKHFDIAICYFKRALGNNPTDYERISILERLSGKFKWKMQFSKQKKQENAAMAIEYQELAIEAMSKCDPASVKTGLRLSDLAKLYELTDNYDRALTIYENALKYYKAESRIRINQICSIYDSIADIYVNHKQDYESALKIQLISHQNILEDCKPHPRNSEATEVSMKITLAISHEKLADIYIKLDRYDLVVEHLLTALNLNEEVNCESRPRDRINADIEIKLADIQLELQQYEIAYSHIENALKVYQRFKQTQTESYTRETDDEEEISDDDSASISSTSYSSDDDIESKIGKIEEKMNNIQKILLTKQAELIVPIQ